MADHHDHRTYPLEEMMRRVDWDLLEQQRAIRESQLNEREAQRNFEQATAEMGNFGFNMSTAPPQQQPEPGMFCYSVTGQRDYNLSIGNGRGSGAPPAATNGAGIPLMPTQQHQHAQQHPHQYSLQMQYQQPPSQYAPLSNTMPFQPHQPQHVERLPETQYTERTPAVPQHNQQPHHLQQHQPPQTAGMQQQQQDYYTQYHQDQLLAPHGPPSASVHSAHYEHDPFSSTDEAWQRSRLNMQQIYGTGFDPIPNRAQVAIAMQSRTPSSDASAIQSVPDTLARASFASSLPESTHTSSPNDYEQSPRPNVLPQTTPFWYTAPIANQVAPEQQFPFHSSLYGPTATRYRTDSYGNRTDGYGSPVMPPPPSYESIMDSHGVASLVGTQRQSLTSQDSLSPTASSSDHYSAGAVGRASADALGRSKQPRIEKATSKSNESAASKSSPEEAEGTSSTKRREKKHLAELVAKCTKCDKDVAHLILRGKATDLLVPHRPVYECVDCAAVPRNPIEPNENAGYGLSISAAADALEGRSIQDKDTIAPPPSARTEPKSFRKRSKRADSVWTPCDVCLRDVAVGAVVAEDARETIEFAVEIICDRCWSRYKRCSECGAGGGARLGVGKWRSKELFDEGRKTCRLPHLRLGALSEMFYDVWACRDLPTEDVDDVTKRCGDIFKNTMLAGMCIPEVLETQSAMCLTYDQVVRMAADGWGLIQRMLREDIEPEKQIRRYVALRTCPPNPRKQRTLKTTMPGNGVFREGAHLAGMVIGEWDQVHGTMYAAVVVPWATGETYDANTMLIQKLAVRMQADREELNFERAALGQTPYPEIKHVWTMLFFARSSRMMNHLEKKRGFLPLADYAEQFSDVDLNAFPPHREVYLPRTFLKGWHVLVRPLKDPEREWAPRQPNNNTAQKKKDVRIRTRRDAPSVSSAAESPASTATVAVPAA